MTSGSDTNLLVRETELGGVVVLEPMIYRDERGSFREIFNRADFESATGVRRQWVQDNHSRSSKDVLRGIHYQIGSPQGKLVSCLAGEIFDVAVDLRKSSPTFGEWTGVVLNERNGNQLWVPEGFGHAFLVMSAFADVVYKVTEAYDPAGDRSIVWDDPDLGINWPLTTTPELSDKDRAAPLLREAETYA